MNFNCDHCGGNDEKPQQHTMDCSKPFPMMGGPKITFGIAVSIYDVYTDLYGHEQSLDRIAERGGFGWAEVELLGNQYQQRRRRKPFGWGWKT